MIYTDGTEFGAYHLSAHPELYQPQMTNNFRFIFPKFDKLLREGKTGEEDDAYIYNVSDTLTVSLSSADMPSYNQEVVKVRRGNSMAKYAGIIEWNDVNLKFNCYEAAGTKDALLAWRSLSYNVKRDTVAALDNIQTDYNYKQNCYLQEYSPDWRLQRTWKLVNAFPTDVSFDGYTFDSANVVTANVKLAYDRAELIYD